MCDIAKEKEDFKGKFREFLGEMKNGISCENGQWTIKGFIDIYKNIYTISSDTKIVSKILELHLYPISAKICGKDWIHHRTSREAKLLSRYDIH